MTEQSNLADLNADGRPSRDALEHLYEAYRDMYEAERAYSRELLAELEQLRASQTEPGEEASS